jgi:phytoene dehydrogenase-like protein
MNKYDIIIIGAGLGGLTAGAKLSKEGKKVLIIEQHKIPGGCATTYKRKDFKVEVGLNALGGLDKVDIKQKIFSELGVFDNVKFLRLAEFYKYRIGEREIVVPDNAEAAIDKLSKEFPEEQKGIKKFFKTILSIRKEINAYCRLKPCYHRPILAIMPFVYPNIVLNMFTTVGKFLDCCTKNEQLKACLVANMSYYHDDPYSMSLLYFSAAQGEFFNGSYFIQGGSQELSNHLASVVTANGGNILYEHMVTRIITKNNKAVGVEFYQKKNEGTKLTEHANIIVANAAIPQVEAKLLLQDVALSLKKKIKGLTNSCSFLVIFLQFKKPVKELGNNSYTIFVNENSHFKIKNWKALHDEDYENRPFYFCDYSQIDAKLCPPEKGQGIICCTDYLENWENLSTDEYKRKKAEVAEILIERLNKIIPGIKDEIEHFEAGTPKTIERYILTPGGSVYGFAQTVRQAVPFRLSVKSPVKNLYFASSWAFPGGGFTGAIISGYTCARTILK